MRKCILHPENECPATDENPQCKCEPPKGKPRRSAFGPNAVLRAALLGMLAVSAHNDKKNEEQK